MPLGIGVGISTALGGGPGEPRPQGLDLIAVENGPDIAALDVTSAIDREADLAATENGPDIAAFSVAGDNPVVADQSFDYGASSDLNKGWISPLNTGAAIVAATITDDPSGLFSVLSNGDLGPTAQGLGGGTYPVDVEFESAGGGSVTATITVTSVPGYSVGTDEIKALFTSHPGTALDGATIWCREDSFPAGTDDSKAATWDLGAGHNGLNVTIRSHDASRPAELKRTQVRFLGSIVFEDLKFHADFDYVTDDLNQGIISSSNNRTDITMRGLEISSTNTDEGNQMYGFTNPASPGAGEGIYRGDDAGGGSTVTIFFDKLDVADQPDLSEIATTGPFPARIVLQDDEFTSTANQWGIVGANDTLKSLTLEALSEGGGNPVPDLRSVDQEQFCLGDIHALNGFVVIGGTTRGDLVVDNCHVHDCFGGIIAGSILSRSIHNSIFERNAFDNTKVGIAGDETKDEVFNNVYGASMGLLTDAQNPHLDMDQTLGGIPHTIDNSTAYKFKGNIIFQKAGRSNVGQVAFNEGLGTGRVLLKEIEHNIIMTTAANCIVLEQAEDLSRIFNNTALFDHTVFPGDNMVVVPQIITTGGDAAVVESENVFIMNNAVGAIDSEGATEGNNKEYGATVGTNTEAIYAVDHIGTAFETTSMADVAAMKAALVPRGTGALFPTGRPGIGAQHTGYWDYEATTMAAGEIGPMYAIAWDPAELVDLTGIPANTVGTSAAVSLSGLGPEGAMIWAVGDGGPELRLTNSGDGEIAPWTAGSTPILAFNGNKLYVRTTAPAVPETDSDVTVWSGRNSSVWSVTAAAGGFAAVAIDNDASAYAKQSSWSGSVGTEFGTLNAWVYFPTALPGTVQIIEGRRSGGNVALSLRTASAGRINFGLYNEAGTAIITKLTSGGPLTADTWHHIFLAWDLSAGTPVCDLYFDGSLYAGSYALDTATADDAADMVQMSVFASVTGVNLMDGYLSEIAYSTTNYYDASISTELEKFTNGGKPVDLTPIVADFDLILNNPLATWENNSGIVADNLVETDGPWIAAASSPSD